MRTVFSTEELDPGEQFDSWCTRMSTSYAPAETWTEDPDDFLATHRLLDLGVLRISAIGSPPVRMRRTERHVRQSAPELFLLARARAGGAAIDQNRCQGVLEPGNLLLYSYARAHDAHLAPDGRTEMVELTVPRSLVPLATPQLDRLLATPLPVADGLGALLVNVMERLTDESVPVTSATAPLLAQAALALTTAFLTHVSDPETPSEAHPHALALEMRAFVDDHLRDPELTPALIAAAHHVSVRTVHRCFEPCGTTPAAYVRERRLDQARRDLVDPRLRSTPIHAIAAAWGFPRASDFSRAFRTRYGRPPSEYRAMTDRDRAALE
ncbi:helix-turn-helix domain-containing protein [Streptomyces sp. NPDC048057]|uniref:helix-turn-helix domain-containing protein n=1 Tax=Streptomyces sp. NPDC048057 TaxID=3155628 RepID=UPI0033DD6A8F